MDDDDVDAEWAAEQAEEEADRLRKAEPAPQMDEASFLAWRSPRTVSEGPTRLDNPLWHWLVRTRWSAFQANNIFHGPSPLGAGPMWCFDRFGKSQTVLPDGRVVHIGGEHEDHYDPDFFIYNDVTVIAPDGSIEIRGYPHDVFPPTDFHSATRVGDTIFIIGCLGYPGQRLMEVTPVYRLQLDGMTITRVETTGEAPGWISEHSAELAPDGRMILVRGGDLWRGAERAERENIDTWALDTANGHWTRASALDWQMWTMLRVDRKRNRLWDTRHALWDRDHPWPGKEDYWRHDEAPDFEALAMLYRLDDDSPAPEDGAEHNEYRVTIDGVVVRFKEDGFPVHAVVEGRLPDERLAALQRKVLATLERIDGSAWEIDKG
jgi:hypothetical protein